MNIYRELFATKLWDKIWPKNSASSSSSSTANDNLNLGNSTNLSISASNEIKLEELNVLSLLNNNAAITESIFEKIALMEFEASIYNQLSSSKILLFYFQLVVANEIKCIRNKPSRTILVSPVEKKEPMLTTTKNSDFFSTWVENTENLKLMSKKLSLTISDLGWKTHKIF